MVTLCDSSYSCSKLKQIGNENGIPCEYVVYSDVESNNDELFKQHLIQSGGQYYQFEVTIPLNYKEPYYPFNIGQRGYYNLDHSELPIIIPIPVNPGTQYNVVYINQYYRENNNDRMKFIVTRK